MKRLSVSSNLHSTLKRRVQQVKRDNLQLIFPQHKSTRCFWPLLNLIPHHWGSKGRGRVYFKPIEKALASACPLMSCFYSDSRNTTRLIVQKKEMATDSSFFIKAELTFVFRQDVLKKKKSSTWASESHIFREFACTGFKYSSQFCFFY